MTNTSNTMPNQTQATWHAYLEMCKPKVVALMLLTALIGMCLASPGFVPLNLLVFSFLGIGLMAGSAAAINHLIDRRIDSLMMRTENRPLPTGQIKPQHAFIFALVLGTLGMVILGLFVNTLTAILTFATLIGYAVIYTVYLKHATPQNIVIGGLAGAMPPLLGWTSVTGYIEPYSLLLVLIIFIWTPPHFWALSIYRYEDYAKTNIPMLPVTHGIAFTTLNILLYTILLIAASILPFVTGMSGGLYLIGALALGFGFLYWAIKLKKTEDKIVARKTFLYSIYYLMGLFLLLLIDHYWKGSLYTLIH